MKTLFRFLLYLVLVVWLGAEAFFPVVAATTFMMLQPDTHSAGAIVGQLLRILHDIGLVAGTLALVLLVIAPSSILYRARHVVAPMALLVLMLICVGYSQFGIIPAMERDRIAAGGAINTRDAANSLTSDFNKLHRLSEQVEGAVLLLGIATVALIAKAETSRTLPEAPEPRKAASVPKEKPPYRR